ncbi:MAG: AfsR/SARP family transcriptional regulator [Nocardioides sp.]|nr:AfsR/SARP family transcriptional regulator [Nocardioidaceae bacterium]MCB8955294.1 AfsR/SARP family transcriptional regulator [Nocardioides sp.]
MSATRTRSTDLHLSPCPDAPASGRFSIDVLGPLQVVSAGREATLSSRRQRALLVLLAMNANAAVTSERLVDQLWDGTPPPGALTTLRSYISHVRRFLDDHVDGRARIATTDAGYRLDVDDGSLDLVRFRDALAEGHRHLRAGEPVEALEAFESALDLWRGDPVAEIRDHDAAVTLAAELAELRVGAVEGRLRALVDTGRHVEAIPGIEALAAAEPLREGPRELLMTALHRAGRSAEALEVHRTFRAVLRDELGIEPGARLDRLVTAILHRDPRLDPPSTAVAPTQVPSPSAAEQLSLLVESLRVVSEQLAAVVDALGPRPVAPPRAVIAS